MKTLPSPVVLSEISKRGPGVVFNDPERNAQQSTPTPEVESPSPEDNAAALDALGVESVNKDSAPKATPVPKV